MVKWAKSQSIDPHETVVVEPETDGEVKADETDPAPLRVRPPREKKTGPFRFNWICTKPENIEEVPLTVLRFKSEVDRTTWNFYRQSSAADCRSLIKAERKRMKYDLHLRTWAKDAKEFIRRTENEAGKNIQPLWRKLQARVSLEPNGEDTSLSDDQCTCSHQPGVMVRSGMKRKTVNEFIESILDHTVGEVQAKFNQLKAEGKEEEAVVLSKQCKWFEYKIRRGLIPLEIFGYDAPKPGAFAYVMETLVTGKWNVKGKDSEGAGKIKKKIQEVGHYADGTQPGINEIKMRTFDQCTCYKSAEPGRYNGSKDKFIEEVLDRTFEEVQAKFQQLKAEGREDEAVVLSKQCKWFELKIRRGLIPLEIFGYDEPKPPGLPKGMLV